MPKTWPKKYATWVKQKAAVCKTSGRRVARRDVVSIDRAVYAKLKKKSSSCICNASKVANKVSTTEAVPPELNESDDADAGVTVDWLDDNHICSICRQVYQDPSKLSCGHNFCDSCIRNALAHGTCCPNCRDPASLLSVTPDTALAQLLVELRTRCPACGKAMSLASRKTHDDECGKLLVKCAHTRFGCQFHDIRDELGTHLEKECPYERIKGLLAVVDEQRKTEAALKERIASLETKNGNLTKALISAATQQNLESRILHRELIALQRHFDFRADMPITGSIKLLFQFGDNMATRVPCDAAVPVNSRAQGVLDWFSRKCGRSDLRFYCDSVSHGTLINPNETLWELGLRDKDVIYVYSPEPNAALPPSGTVSGTAVRQ